MKIFLFFLGFLTFVSAVVGEEPLGDTSSTTLQNWWAIAVCLVFFFLFFILIFALFWGVYNETPYYYHD